MGVEKVTCKLIRSFSAIIPLILIPVKWRFECLVKGTEAQRQIGPP
jgi:hypothetical protein